MKVAAWLSGFVILLGFAIGWMAAKPPPHLSGPARIGQIQRPVSGGEIASNALERFAELAPIAPDPPPDTGPPPPPPPDVAVTFRRELTAIDTSGSQPVVYIVDFNGEHSRRGLRRGDVYRDGWRVASVTPQEVVLRKRRETRTIQVFELPEPADGSPGQQ